MGYCGVLRGIDDHCEETAPYFAAGGPSLPPFPTATPTHSPGRVGPGRQVLVSNAGCLVEAVFLSYVHAVGFPSLLPSTSPKPHAPTHPLAPGGGAAESAAAAEEREREEEGRGAAEGEGGVCRRGSLGGALLFSQIPAAAGPRGSGGGPAQDVQDPRRAAQPPLPPAVEAS